MTLPAPPPPAAPREGLTLDERFELCRSVGEECIQEEELRNLLDKKPVPVCYDGFRALRSHAHRPGRDEVSEREQTHQGGVPLQVLGRRLVRRS